MCITQLKEQIKNSPFGRSYYGAHVGLANFIDGVLFYTHNSEYDQLADVFNAVPDFQRNNDKWTQPMQVKFIENLIMRYRTQITLFEVLDKDDPLPRRDNCQILDGLQRLTAIYQFQVGQIEPFGFSFDELRAERVITRSSHPIEVRIYSFKDMREAIEFYIAMNENITHSPADIAKAKKVLAGIGDDNE